MKINSTSCLFLRNSRSSMFYQSFSLNLYCMRCGDLLHFYTSVVFIASFKHWLQFVTLTIFFPFGQIQHPRSHLNRFDMVITPHHDYYPLTPEGQKQVPKFLRRWITPREPPDSHVVCVMCSIWCDCIRFYYTGDNAVLLWC